jgi:hypothetical protein
MCRQQAPAHVLYVVCWHSSTAAAHSYAVLLNKEFTILVITYHFYVRWLHWPQLQHRPTNTVRYIFYACHPSQIHEIQIFFSVTKKDKQWRINHLTYFIWNFQIYWHPNIVEPESLFPTAERSPSELQMQLPVYNLRRTFNPGADGGILFIAHKSEGKQSLLNTTYKFPRCNQRGIQNTNTELIHVIGN